MVERAVAALVSSGKLREIVRALIIVMIALIASYMSSSARIDSRVQAVEIKEQTHFEEVLRRLDGIQDDVREIRRGK